MFRQFKATPSRFLDILDRRVSLRFPHQFPHWPICMWFHRWSKESHKQHTGSILNETSSLEIQGKVPRWDLNNQDICSFGPASSVFCNRLLFRDQRNRQREGLNKSHKWSMLENCKRGQTICVIKFDVLHTLVPLVYANLDVHVLFDRRSALGAHHASLSPY